MVLPTADIGRLFGNLSGLTDLIFLRHSIILQKSSIFSSSDIGQSITFMLKYISKKYVYENIEG